MSTCVDNTQPNGQSHLKGLIKGDFKILEKLPEPVRTEEITFDEFEVNADSVNDLLQISDQIEFKLETYRIPVHKRINFVIALVEAINNAQKHGYRFAQNKIIAINLFTIANDYIMVGIESIGEPIPYVGEIVEFQNLCISGRYHQIPWLTGDRALAALRK